MNRAWLKSTYPSEEQKGGELLRGGGDTRHVQGGGLALEGHEGGGPSAAVLLSALMQDTLRQPVTAPARDGQQGYTCAYLPPPAPAATLLALLATLSFLLLRWASAGEIKPSPPTITMPSTSLMSLLAHTSLAWFALSVTTTSYRTPASRKRGSLSCSQTCRARPVPPTGLMNTSRRRGTGYNR